MLAPPAGRLAGPVLTAAEAHRDINHGGRRLWGWDHLSLLKGTGAWESWEGMPGSTGGAFHPLLGQLKQGRSEGARRPFGRPHILGPRS